MTEQTKADRAAIMREGVATTLETVLQISKGNGELALALLTSSLGMLAGASEIPPQEIFKGLAMTMGLTARVVSADEMPAPSIAPEVQPTRH
jgi:hypothetical protein